MEKDHHHVQRRLKSFYMEHTQGEVNHTDGQVFKSFYMDHTQGEVNHVDGQVPKPSLLDDLLGVSRTSMDVSPSSVNGETELNVYIRVQEVVNDTDPLMCWKQYQQEFKRSKSSHT